LFREANRVLDSLRRANLTGSFRDAAVLVLGLSIVSASTAVQAPQTWIILTSGAVLTLAGTVFLVLRLWRSYRERKEL